MQTKILNIDVSAFPSAVSDLVGFERAYVLFWYEDRVVGQRWFEVINGRINQTELEDAIFNPHSWPLWEQITRQQLPDFKIEQLPLPQATVAVCTRDRPDDIKNCLAGFMQLPDDGQEFLVIDNCPSTDETYQIVQGYNGRIRYIREDRPGLDNARNRALKEASHDIIVFNDDDATPSSNWLRELLKNFTHPDILCVTGLTLPSQLDTDAQVAFEQFSTFNRGFVRKVHHGTPLMAGHVGAGANMALRKSVLTKVGGFDPALDSGTASKSGGDTEMFARILGKGYQIVYDPTAVSWHRHRRSWGELQKTFYGYGVGTYAMWTRMLFKDKNLGVLKAAWQHLRYYQLPMIWQALTKQHNAIPLDLALAELRGCLKGTVAYWQATRQLKQSGGAS